MNQSLDPADRPLGRRDFIRRTGLVTTGAALLPVLQACGGGGDSATQTAQKGTKRSVPTLAPMASPPTYATLTPSPATAPTAPANTAATSAPPAANGTEAPAGGETVVEMTNELKFVPGNLTIKVGQTVTWKNVGVIPHTSTDDASLAINAADAKLPDGAKPWNSDLLNGGQSWSHTFDVSGDYVYFCIPHEAAGMVARLTVTP